MIGSENYGILHILLIVIGGAIVLEKIKDNKLKIILLIIVIVGVVVCVKSCIGKREADLKLAYVGYGFVDTMKFDAFKDELGEIVGDINGDGKALCEMTEISFNENLTSADFANSQQKLMSAVGNGAARLYIMNYDFVEANKDNDVFKDLSNLSGEGIRNSAGEIVAISLKNSKSVLQMGLSGEEELYIAVRKISEMDSVMYKNIEKVDKAADIAAEYILNN